ncbi:MAG TPA: hypothetical protein VII94_04605 [Candidatus Saccharimonadales bacterium]
MNYTRQYDGKRIDCEYGKCAEWHYGGHELNDMLPQDSYYVVHGDKKWSYCIVCDMATSLDSFVHEQCRKKLLLRVTQKFGMSAGSLRKQWVIDQMLRAILGNEQYQIWVKEILNDPAYASWEVGCAP